MRKWSYVLVFAAAIALAACESSSDGGSDAVGGNGQCTPDCTGKTCGDDGCGGECGQCPGGFLCNGAFECVSSLCEQDCAGLTCGLDLNCQLPCGECPAGEVCVNDACVADTGGTCIPDCAGRICGDDGCGGLCGIPCAGGQVCQNGICVDDTACTPSCEGKSCGDSDGCDGFCGGSCPFGFECRGADGCQRIGSCTKDCEGKSCGDDDGCGGLCDGSCPGDEVCTDGVCGSAPARKCNDDELGRFTTCAQDCGQNMQCQSGCLSELSDECTPAYNALAMCAQRSGCSQTDVQCVQTNCADQFTEVFGEGGGQVEPTDCNPVSGEGCPAGQNCTLLSQTEIGCAPAGTVGYDQPCGPSNLCARGACVDIGEGNKCYEACYPAANQCPDSRPCQQVDPDGEYGLCGPAPTDCNLLQQNCPDGQGCYPMDYQGGTGCAPSQNKTAGMQCTYVNECAPGHLCAATQQGAPSTCIPLCDTEGGQPTCAAGQQCAPAQLTGHPTVGACI